MASEHERRLTEYEAQVDQLQEMIKGLEEEVVVLRRRLQDAPKRVRTLEERLLETKGQLAQAVSQNEKLSATLRNGVVAFETDEIDPATSTGWSVTVVGRIQEITDLLEIERLDAALTPWAPGERDHFLKIIPEVVTGRRLTARGRAATASRGGAAGLPRRRLTERDTPLENGPPLRSWPYDQSSI